MQAHPLDLHLGEKQLVLLHQVGEFAEAVPVGLFHPGDVLEHLAHQGEALAHGGLGEAVVVVLPLLVLVVLGGAQVIQHPGADVHRVGAVHLDGLAGTVLQGGVELLGVDPLLLGGEEEHPLDDGQPRLVGHPGGDGVAVSGLALPGEGPHEIFPGLAAEKGLGFVGHSKPSFCAAI